METEGTVDTQKAAYDAVNGREPVRESEIKMLVSQYGKLLGKDRIVRVAGNLANQLITVVGVETYNDLRNVTFEIYADRCGLQMIDAALLVRQFGVPVAPPVDAAVVEAARSTKMPMLSQPSQGEKLGTTEGDGDLYDVKAPEERNAAPWNPFQVAQGVAQRVPLSIKETVDSTSQSMGQGLPLLQEAGNVYSDTPQGAGSESTTLTVSTAPSQAQSLQESLAQSMVQMSQALVASAAQTQAMLAQGVGRLPVLKLDGRSRPKVKAVKAWVKDIGDKRFSVRGFTAALDMLRKAPEKMSREDFTEIYISAEDDKAMYHQVKSSMSEVYDLMSIQMTRVERKSTMGLIYDAMMFAIRKDQMVIASKINWLINDVPTMMEYDDMPKVFDAWDDTMTEVQHSGMITNEMIVQSMETMMVRFQPQIHRAQGESEYYHKRNVDKYVASMRMQVDAMTERFAVMKKRTVAAKEKQQDKRGKGKGRGKGSSKGKGRAHSGDTTESDTDDDSRSKGSRQAGKGAGKERGMCWDFQKYGECWKKNCPWKPCNGGGMVMMMDKMDELTERLSAMQGSAGDVRCRGQSHDPKPTLNTVRAHHTAMTPVNMHPHLLMSNVRVRERGHRQGLRVHKGQESRTHRVVSRQYTAQGVTNKNEHRGTHKVVSQTPHTQAVTPKPRRQDTQRGRGHVHGDEVPTRKKLKTPKYDEYMKARQVKADMPVKQGQVNMTVGPVVDTAASLSVVTARDKKHLTNVRPLGRTEVVLSAGGTTEIKEAGALQVGAITIPKVVPMDKSPVSVVAMQDLAAQDYTLVQAATYAGLVKEDKVIELVPDKSGMFRLPVSTTERAVGIEVQRALAQVKHQVSERSRLERIAHQKVAHYPKCPVCPECVEANMEQGDGVRGPLQPIQKLDIGFDLVGPMVKSNNGNIYKLVATERYSGVGWSEGIPNKQDLTVLQAVKVCIARIRLLHKEKENVTIRFHTDMDASFKGKVADYVMSQSWLQTDTGGYDSNGNSKVERRNKKLQAGVRALLLGATGGRLYYEELWDEAMGHMADLTNHMPEAGGDSPAKKAGGEELEVEDMMEAFGAQAYYFEAPERRQTGSKQTDTRGRLGVWVGRSHTINGGHRIAPIQWDMKTGMWKVQPTVERPYVEINNGEFPLRKVQKQGGDPVKFEDFVCRMAPNAMVPEVYVVDKVVNVRVKSGEVEYKVRWQGYTTKEDTWEPADNLLQHGAQEAVAKFHAKHPDKVGKHVLCYMVMHLEYASEEEKAVEALLRQHKLKGSVGDWLPSYRKELDTVIGKRLREVTGEEYKQVLKTQKVVKLRMNPEPKKDGRLKMRLLLKGFLEPKEWTGRTDSPTVMASTVRTLVAMGTDESDPDIAGEADDVVSAGDITGAFLVGDGYAPGEMPRWVGYRPYKGAHMRVFQLLGPLYGQRDASYRWWESLSTWLLQQGFERSKHDQCLFVNPITHMRLAVHVDDILARGSRKQSEIFWAKLNAKYPLKEWEAVDYDNPVTYTGYTIGKVTKNGKPWYTMDMCNDIAAFLSDTEQDGSRPVAAPMPYMAELTKDKGAATEQEHKWYRSILGSLQWYTGVRYDIAYEVSRLAQMSAAPTKGALKALKRLLGYISTTRDRQLMVPRVTGCVWTTYSDSDHAGDMGMGTSRSHTGVVMLLNGMPVHWRSQKQPKTSLSSAAAEIYAMSRAVKDACLRLWVAEDMHVTVKWPMTLHVDNAAGVSFQHTTCGNTQMKGIFKMSEDWVQELKDEAKVMSVHVPTDRNLADMLTKGLSVDVRNKLDAIMAQIAETIATGGDLQEAVLGSKSKMQVGKKVKGKLAAAAK